jgi:hypothetical protein
LEPSIPTIRSKKFYLDIREDLYDYKKASTSEGSHEWHVNFADTHLFFGFNTGLFAQDEIQVAEMPTLAHLRGTKYYDHVVISIGKLVEQSRDPSFLLAPLTRYSNGYKWFDILFTVI